MNVNNNVTNGIEYCYNDFANKGYWYYTTTGGTTLTPDSLKDIPASPINVNYGYYRTYNDKYAIMDLPRKECPITVFVNGRMLTLGIIGTGVECSYTSGQIIFEPRVIEGMNERAITLSLEYPDAIYHYNIGDQDLNIFKSLSSSQLKVTLLSTIKKKGVTAVPK